MKAAVLGAGVIGCGWVARFVMHGWDVAVYDPDAQVSVRLAVVLDRARGVLNRLYDRPLPAEGEVEFTRDAAAAVAEADWVQESLPESLPIKRDLYSQVQDTLGEATPLASSTSGFKPSDLAAGFIRAPQLLVCHPFNPVYLLPVVEVVPTDITHADIVSSATAILTQIGMKPVVVRSELDAHIGDRLLEALWREALWLVADGVATTTEIDDVIRYGFGLRWAQMGLFETYRIAGGEKGIRNFLTQFGPALEWPWSKLTDVPDLDDGLIEKITAQSDEQSGHRSITELELRRDNNLVAIIRALKKTNSGAGKLINAMDARLERETNRH